VEEQKGENEEGEEGFKQHDAPMRRQGTKKNKNKKNKK